MREVDKSLYPSTDDIRYAGQLKAFAARLPAYASRYDLPPLEVLKVQGLVLEFMELLVHRMRYATEHIHQRRRSSAASSQLPDELATSWHEYKCLLHAGIGEVVGQIKQHAAYTAADGEALCLTLFPE